MDQTKNFLVPTDARPFTSVAPLPGVGFKPLNVLDKPRIWSAVVRIEAGQLLPAHQNSAPCEMFVVRGKGRYATGATFTGGDYIRETAGDYEQIEAQEELVFFVTHQGTCTFLGPGGADAFVADSEFLGAQLQS